MQQTIDAKTAMEILNLNNRARLNQVLLQAGATILKDSPQSRRAMYLADEIEAIARGERLPGKDEALAKRRTALARNCGGWKGGTIRSERYDTVCKCGAFAIQMGANFMCENGHYNGEKAPLVANVQWVEVE